MIRNNRFEVSYFLAHEILSRFLVRDDVRRQVEILKAEADAEGTEVIHEKLQFEHRLRFGHPSEDFRIPPRYKQEVGVSVNQ